MSCNPSIGGIGKGTLVREIDALGGVVGRVADLSAISFKVLNQSKGPAVFGPRAQMDRDLYNDNMHKVLTGNHPLVNSKPWAKNLEILEASVHKLHVQDGKCKGIVLASGEVVESEAVILTTGTFLGGRVHIGERSTEAGRFMRSKDKVITDFDETVLESPSNEMSRSVRALGFPVDRLRTGTPPRIAYDSIDFSRLEP